MTFFRDRDVAVDGDGNHYDLVTVYGDMEIPESWRDISELNDVPKGTLFLAPTIEEGHEL